jgi:hypothetical protein
MAIICKAQEIKSTLRGIAASRKTWSEKAINTEETVTALMIWINSGRLE